MTTISRALSLAVLATTLLACASTPETLRGEFEPLDPATATDDDIGLEVRWGGRLLTVTPERDRTCFEILALPLDRSARPLTTESPGRRFLACHDGFTDPAAFPERRLITVTGTLEDFETRPIGGYEYRFPVLAAASIHLWAERRDPVHDPYRYPYYYDPYWRHDPFYYPAPRRLRPFPPY